MQNTEEDNKFTDYAFQIDNRKDFIALKARHWI